MKPGFLGNPNTETAQRAFSEMNFPENLYFNPDLGLSRKDAYLKSGLPWGLVRAGTRRPAARCLLCRLLYVSLRSVLRCTRKASTDIRKQGKEAASGCVRWRHGRWSNVRRYVPRGNSKPPHYREVATCKCTGGGKEGTTLRLRLLGKTFAFLCRKTDVSLRDAFQGRREGLWEALGRVSKPPLYRKVAIRKCMCRARGGCS